jgi:hypothetical protein
VGLLHTAPEHVTHVQLRVLAVIGHLGLCSGVVSLCASTAKVMYAGGDAMWSLLLSSEDR